MSTRTIDGQAHVDVAPDARERAAREALRQVLDIADGSGAVPNEWEVIGESNSPRVTLRFLTLDEIRRFAAADRAKLEHDDHRIAERGFRLWFAMYDRPGRRMLLKFYAFPHSPEWTEGEQP